MKTRTYQVCGSWAQVALLVCSAFTAVAGILYGAAILLECAGCGVASEREE